MHCRLFGEKVRRNKISDDVFLGDLSYEDKFLNSLIEKWEKKLTTINFLIILARKV